MIHLSSESQEYFGWAGNGVFLLAQLFQIAHTTKIKTTKDISYGLQVLFVTGNVMYTTFGLVTGSPAMLIGNGASLLLSLVQLSQKVYYDNYYVKHGYTQLGEP